MTGLAMTGRQFDAESSNHCVSLRGVKITARLAGMGIKAIVEQTFVNQESIDIEAVYTFPLPSEAAICHFEVITDERVLTGKIEDADTAIDKYEDAIKSYEAALAARPGWRSADTNLGVAKARLALLPPPESDHGGTGGKLEADEIVFDDRAAESPSVDKVEVVGMGDELSDQDMRSLWLRRVESKPATFLRSKFAYQLAEREAFADVDD
jgi:hypothetical protein